ncbi:MAG: DUF3105 domain-containing protein [Actinomycetota bacterium]
MRLAAWCCALSLFVVACGGDDAASACVELREPEDQASGRHVLSEGAVEYQTDPPTSGPHIAGPTPEGVLDVSIAPEIQVRLLEAGGVMVQYDATVEPAELEPLTTLASAALVIAPAAGDLPDRIVATAWTWKLSCGVVDVDRVRSFATERSPDAPGLD